MSSASRIVALRADALPPTHAKPACRLCGCETGYLVRYINSRNRSSLRWACDWCHDVYTALDLPYELLGPKPNLNEIPKIDRSLEDSGVPPCEVCDGLAKDWHHWAPSAIFPDWPDVPVPLCVDHHREWHDRMRHHGLKWPHELEGSA